MLLMLFSNLGQTYFIGLYSPDIRATFGLSHSAFGGLYSVLTLISALLLLQTGTFIDRIALPRLVAFVGIGLGLSCLLLGFATSLSSFLPPSLSLAAFALGLFGVRHIGQGLCSHTAITAMSRAYEKFRASATAVAQLGYAGGEAVLPLASVWLTLWFGWQGGWVLLGGLLLLLGLPALLYLSAGEPDWRSALQSEQGAGVQQDRAAVLHDARFYLLLPVYTAPAFLLTGMFFHHSALAESRGWTLADVAYGFVIYALSKVVCSLLAGALVDRYTALRLMPLTALPLMAAFGVVALPALLQPGAALVAWFVLCGVAIGFIVPASSALWPELFGTRHLGSIRSLTSGIGILSTAIAPVLFGVGIDAGLGFGEIGGLSLIYLAVTALLALLAGRVAPATPKQLSG